MFLILSTCKGGGYMYARTDPPHPKRNSNDLYPLHRVLMENKLGRPLKDGEVVHHVDGNKDNNDTSNLAVMLNEEHSREHKPTLSPKSYTCDWCGSMGHDKPRFVRLRAKRNVGNKLFCSRSCAAFFRNSLRVSRTALRESHKLENRVRLSDPHPDTGEV